jgi:hypothetical protein
MAHKKKHQAPIPKANRSRGGPGAPPLRGPGAAPLNEQADEQVPNEPTTGTGFQEQDAKKRLGNYGGAGEHPYVQPGGRNDANR